LKHVLLGITGGIAAYKAAELVRLLRQQNYDVRVVMTDSAMKFITPLTLQALSGHAVHSKLLDASEENAMGHINLARWADILLIAPATANCIAKFTHGLADDLLSTLFLVVQCPIYIAPAMNQSMWHNLATQDNIAQLSQRGVSLIGPESGSQACGETGLGRMSEPYDIVAALHAPEQILLNKKLLITAGPTREPLDPVRYISNRSSGKMGYALAEQAEKMGAEVTLISGPVTLPQPKNVHVIMVETAAEMYSSVMQHVALQDMMIAAAAVADYTPAVVQSDKIKKQGDESTLALQKTQDIIACVASLANKPFTVGFAAETKNLEHYAQDKLQRKNLDIIAANLVGQAEGGFDSAVNALQVYWRDGNTNFPMTNKNELASQLLALISERYHAKNSA
jgi:phosphopantothenoylcysteine decarboxylase/phosphopantothenate--cysteine ligase